MSLVKSIKTAENPLHIQKIAPTEKSDLFIQYLPKPTWFIQKFRLIFDQHRQLTRGVIFLAVLNKTNSKSICGCIYVELKPQHFY
jgi:hypothetical protein